jgi:signal transduction histidine kinase
MSNIPRGEMARRFQEFDWSATAIGSPASWPESWRNAVRIILDSSFPTALGLGDQLVYFYNDAFIPLGGPARHPSALGLPVSRAWWEIWDQILAPRFRHTIATGEPTGEADLLMPLERSGYLEETYITFSFAPLRDDQNRPNGIFCTAIENTERIIAQRQINCLRSLASQSSFAQTPQEACSAAAATLEGNPRDVPFALLYLLEADGRRAHLAGTAGLTSTPATVPATIDLSRGAGAWSLDKVAAVRTAVLVDNVQELIAGALRSPDLTPQRALALPIASAGAEHLAGILVAGVNPMRPLAESRTFHELVAKHLETAIAHARAQQHVRERARQLAELDRAKTVFFSNISHELRTPLTLLLSPLEEVLDRAPLSADDRESLRIARRGAGRLLKLVNSLLEFSRIEAGRAEASFEALDLAVLTADLASTFRSAFERAGVRLVIDCPPLPQPVFVDRDMWEKIVLNLLSNAFKFTLTGEVCIRQRLQGDHIELQVSDTGCGIATEDLPRLFERFFRGRATQARTHEGSGIGLSLVQELVKLHGGRITAASEPGVGTTLTVRIPQGSAHLPQERVGSERRLDVARIGAEPFVEEALGWLPQTWSVRERESSEPPTPAPDPLAHETNDNARILVVDDNADMRSYLARLLAQRWRVETASEGLSALEQVRSSRPDLVIADVMMPGLDGYGLLQALRRSDLTADIPVLLLSARAGEEASAEGLRAGADDYVTKPFTARELLARVEARLAQARLRAAERAARQAAEHANRARDEFFAMLSHELRSPLMALIAWAEVLKGAPPGSTDALQAIDLIARNARIQRRLVDDLLDLSRIVTDRLRIEARALPSLEPLLSTVVESFRPVALAKHLTIHTQIEPHSGPVRGDPERLQQVVWNLLSNAIRFTPVGGRIEVRCGRRGAHVVLTVRDTGLGIAPEALPHLFERYWQDRHPQQRSSQGLGLGLAIAHRIVELHDGRIAARSDGAGRGATFTVELPLASGVSGLLPRTDGSATEKTNTRIQDAVTAELELATQTTQSESLDPTDTLESARDSAAGHGLRILLVEDHDGIARACQRLLASHGHRVLRVGSIGGAIAAVQRHTFDALICDLRLRDGAGTELLPRLRARLPTKDGQVAAIAVSGSVFDEEIARSLAAGFAAHLSKPFDESTLLAALAQVTSAPGG